MSYYSEKDIMSDMRILVIIPTYNELSNIKKLVPDILKMYPNVDILVVDDNSPDGTAQFIEEFGRNNSHIKLLKRGKKMGLGTAYVAGFKHMLSDGYDAAVQMDADYSHDPAEIKKFLEKINSYDLVIGSRYINGVRVVNWPIKRLLLSYFANLYTRIITGMPVNDATGGFNKVQRIFIPD